MKREREDIRKPHAASAQVPETLNLAGQHGRSATSVYLASPAIQIDSCHLNFRTTPVNIGVSLGETHPGIFNSLPRIIYLYIMQSFEVPSLTSA